MDLTSERVLFWLDQWVHGAIFQGKRLMRHLEAQTSPDIPPEPWTSEQWRAFNDVNVLGDVHLVEDLEGYFFMASTRKAMGWFRRACVAAPELTESIDAFMPFATHVVDVRDMIEHEDAYLEGDGRRQHRYVQDGLPAHSTKLRGDEYFVGGRVSAPNLLKALETLQPHVRRAWCAAAEKEKATQAMGSQGLAT